MPEGALAEPVAHLQAASRNRNCPFGQGELHVHVPRHKGTPDDLENPHIDTAEPSPPSSAAELIAWSIRPRAQVQAPQVPGAYPAGRGPGLDQRGETIATLPEIAQHFDISEASTRSKADSLVVQG